MKRHLWFALPVLLALPMCASAPTAQVVVDGTTVTVDLPPFPKWVPTRRGPVSVTLVHRLQCNDAPAYGCYHYQTHTIDIEDTLPPVLRWRYLRHEMFHAAMDAAGVKFDSRDEENVVAEAMAEQQLAELLHRWPR